MLLLAFAVLVATYGIVRFFSSDDNEPIFGVYHQRSKWYPLKYFLFFCVFHAVKCVRRWTGGTSPQPKAFDRALPLLKDVKAFDGVHFTGGNRAGYYFIMSGERCHRNVANGFFYLLVPKLGLLCSGKLPDTILFEGGRDYFGAEGILLAPVVSMKKWKLRFRGFMWLYPDKSKKFRVRFAAQWSTEFDSFDCLEQFNTRSLTRSIATEAWTNEFFENTGRSLNVLYYQTGSVTVDCIIGGDIHDFSAMSLKCHSYGTKWDLLTLHRAAYFHLFLDSGVTAAIGVVSRRCSISSLELGYVQKADGSIHPVEWCDFRLYQHGECGRPPLDHGFQFKAGDVVYTVQLKVLYEHMHFVGWNWEVKVIERFVKCVINGVFGQGVSEFQYRNTRGRPSADTIFNKEWKETCKSAEHKLDRNARKHLNLKKMKGQNIPPVLTHFN